MNAYLSAVIFIALFVLLLLSGFFSAAETAFTGFSVTRMKALAQTDKRARAVLKMNADYGRVLTALLIGNNLVNILATSLATILFTAHFGDVGVTLSTVVMTVLVLVFGEVSPKTVAKERPEEFALFSCRAIYMCAVIFRPLCFLFELWKRLLGKVFRLDKKRPSITEDELKIIVADMAWEGVLHANEEELIKNAIRYDDLRVASCMIPLKNVTCIEIDDGMADILEVFERSGFSRVPVIVKGMSGVAGILHRVDFYEMRLSGRADITKILKPAFRCKPYDKLPELLKRMQAEKKHLAVVMDGARFLGIITAEDILKELVGEIY